MKLQLLKCLCFNTAELIRVDVYNSVAYYTKKHELHHLIRKGQVF
jgi:hypothetical protein